MLELHISYFAWVRECMGRSAEVAVVPCAVADAGALIGWLAARDAAGGAAFAVPGRICVAIDGVMAGHDAALTDRCDVALFPPVTGG